MISGVLLILIVDKQVFAESPSFSRNEIKDEPKDWINLANGSSLIDKYSYMGNQIGDISSIDYTSDGKWLNVTFWLYSKFYNNTLQNIDISYVMYIDSDLNRGTGIEGGDYKIELKWDNRNQQWVRQFSEIESHDPKRGNNEKRLLENIILKSNSLFYKDRNRYITLSADLSKMGFPEKYRVLFYTAQKSDSILDFTNWIQIPPIRYELSITPDPITLSQDNPSKTVRAQVMPISESLSSMTGFSIAKITSPQDFMQFKLIINEENKTDLSKVQSFNIHMKNDTLPGKYPISVLFSVFTNITYPSPLQVNSFISSQGTESLEETLWIEVQPPQSLIDKILSWISNIFNPFTGVYSTVSTIVSGILGWKLWKRKKDQKEDHKNNSGYYDYDGY